MDTKEVERVALEYAMNHLPTAKVEHIQLAGVAPGNRIVFNIRCVDGNQSMMIQVKSEFAVINAEVIL